MQISPKHASTHLVQYRAFIFANYLCTLLCEIMAKLQYIELYVRFPSRVSKNSYFTYFTTMTSSHRYFPIIIPCYFASSRESRWEICSRARWNFRSWSEEHVFCWFMDIFLRTRPRHHFQSNCCLKRTTPSLLFAFRNGPKTTMAPAPDSHMEYRSWDDHIFFFIGLLLKWHCANISPCIGAIF